MGEDDENDNGVIDGTESQRLGVGGKTTAELQTPTDYTGIYAAWNVDLNRSLFSNGVGDEPWDFGTTTQYPALSLDLNDDNRATWQEFGYQVRDGLTLTATTTESQAQVVLSWDAVSTSPWNSDPPDVSYTLYRDDGTTVEAIAENLTGLSHTDTNNVMINDDYTYWVAAVVDGGEAARSAPVVVIAGAGNQPPVAVGIVADRELLVGATAVVVDVAGVFDDPGRRHTDVRGKFVRDLRRHSEPVRFDDHDHAGERGPDNHHRDGDRRRRIEYERVAALHSDGRPRLRCRRGRAYCHQ